MKPQTALVWIILAVLMLAYLIYYNIKMTKILRKVLKLTDESKDRCVSLLDRMRSCTDRKEQKDILREYEAEEQKMTEIFSKIGLKLIDFKLEYGRLPDGTIIQADEISPDTSSIWDADKNHVDKDVYRRDLGDLIPVYQKVLAGLQAEFEGK